MKMKKYLSALGLVALFGCGKDEPVKDVCYDCVQTLTVIEGLKQTETKKTQEMCGFTAKNFFEKNFTFTNNFGNVKEFSVGKCTEKK